MARPSRSVAAENSSVVSTRLLARLLQLERGLTSPDAFVKFSAKRSRRTRKRSSTKVVDRGDRVYFDSGVIVKLYVPEPNSADAIRLVTASPPPGLLTDWQAIEVRNAFRLKRFRGEISPSQLRSALRSFADDERLGLRAPERRRWAGPGGISPGGISPGFVGRDLCRHGLSPRRLPIWTPSPGFGRDGRAPPEPSASPRVSRQAASYPGARHARRVPYRASGRSPTRPRWGARCPLPRWHLPSPRRLPDSAPHRELGHCPLGLTCATARDRLERIGENRNR